MVKKLKLYKVGLTYRRMLDYKYKVIAKDCDEAGRIAIKVFNSKYTMDYTEEKVECVEFIGYVYEVKK